MKKRSITMAFALTLCLSTGVFAACAGTTTTESQETASSTEVSVEVSTNTEETSEAIDETSGESVEDTTSEATEESIPEATEEPTGNSSEEVTGEIAPTSTNYDIAYKAYMNYIDAIENAKDSDCLYGFVWEYGLQEADTPYILVVSKIGSDEVSQFISVDGQIKEDHTTIYDRPTLTYETIKKLPILKETYGFSEQTTIHESIADGLYYGSLWAVSLDGTKVLATFGKPIIISQEQYDSFKEGDNLGEVLGLPEYSDEYYTLDADGFFGDDLQFGKYNDEGQYILYGASDCIMTYDAFVSYVNIASGCAITDRFIWLGASDEYDESSVSDSLIHTYFYKDMTSPDGMHGQYYPNHNGWTDASSILEPVVIKDGSITDITLGWR